MTKAGRNGRRMKGQFHDHVKFVQISQFVQIFFCQAQGQGQSQSQKSKVKNKN